MTESPPPEYSELPPVAHAQPVNAANGLDFYQPFASSQVAASSHEYSNSVSSSSTSFGSPSYGDDYSTLSPRVHFATCHHEKSEPIFLRPDCVLLRPDAVLLSPSPQPSSVPSPTTPGPRSPTPGYRTPKTYKIGNQTVNRSLVPIAEIKGHLALLRSFVELKKSVKSAVIQLPHVPEDKERKWTWFVGLAVERYRGFYRFDVWCRALSKEDSTKAAQVVFPPLDVLMVWHSYMLNPRWYAEDCIRIPACQALSNFERHFKQFLKDPWQLDDPSEECVNFWMSKTCLGYHPLVEMHKMTQKRITCPKCNEPIRVELMKKDGTGYFQTNFATMCKNKSCTVSSITKETLAVRKLIQDLTAEMTLHDTRPSSHLAGTFLTSSSADKKKGLSMKQYVRERAEAFSETLPWARDLNGSLEPHQLYLVVLEQCGYSMKVLKRLMGLSNQSPRLVNRIMNAYNHDMIYSVELVGAVLRQGSFIEKMSALGWTSPGFFDESDDELVLEHAMARYHAFLDLMHSSSTSFIVPTLDIDLVWHTHQLSPEKYQTDCNKYLRRFVDQRRPRNEERRGERTMMGV